MEAKRQFTLWYYIGVFVLLFAVQTYDERDRFGQDTPSAQLPPGVDPEIGRIIAACLETDPSKRPPSALAIAGRLPGGDSLTAAIAEGAVLSGPDLAFAGDFYEDEFLPAYTEVSGEDAPISVFHAHAFDAYNMLAQAIEEVAFDEDGTTFIPRTALRDAFMSIEGYEGITGTLTCDENGDCADAKISVVG